MAQRVLVASDQPFEAGLLREFCESAGYETASLSEADALVDTVRASQPNLVVLDVALGGGRGFELCRRLKGDAALSEVPVLIVTDGGANEARLRAMELGVEDSISRPLRLVEMRQRLGAAMRTREYRRELEEARGRLDALDTLDPVTRVGNYQRLRLTLEYEFHRATRYGRPLSCAFVRLESVAVTDALLVEAIERLKASLRAADVVFRFDTEQFAVLLPETDAAGAKSAVQRMLASLQRSEAFLGVTAAGGRVILGAATYPHPAVTTHDALLRAALADTDRAQKLVPRRPFAAADVP